ncbi:MAG: hypothetical protein FWC20_08925 [Oscillospiraceae bacterium]|nr:hypothetical protein [Oscillospiraceae bacterium]MCL2279512.1 hypothetical protein [Oscillospiraceae bacterium]
MVEILPAHDCDLPEILSLQKLAFHEAVMRYDDFNIPPNTQTLHELREEAKSHRILTAIESGKIICSVRACTRKLMKTKVRRRGLVALAVAVSALQKYSGSAPPHVLPQTHSEGS